ncbi:MAG TPA: CsbD family protein, partial [Candidatus Dormibacteraeota bacterium]|nr:CsbD family protein [Candidatus Dormibacteraeota bacterium]
MGTPCLLSLHCVHRSRRFTMGGEVDKAGGRIKQAAGDLTDDKDLKARGKAQNAAGDVKDAGSKASD